MHLRITLWVEVMNHLQQLYSQGCHQHLSLVPNWFDFRGLEASWYGSNFIPSSKMSLPEQPANSWPVQSVVWNSRRAHVPRVFSQTTARCCRQSAVRPFEILEDGQNSSFRLYMIWPSNGVWTYFEVHLLLMEEILHQLIYGKYPHHLQGFVRPRWCRMFSIKPRLAPNTWEISRCPWHKKSPGVQALFDSTAKGLSFAKEGLEAQDMNDT